MIGQRLGSFLIEDKIGSGAMGEVYLAKHVKSNRMAAVKVISNDFLQRENALKRFTREAEILEHLRHDNIVRYYARGKYQGTVYYAMEFVEGRNLDSLIEERGYLPWREVVELAIQLCHALQYAHDNQVIHRDLKPSNLMITKDNCIKLTDFGIAKDLDAEALTQTGRTLGTAAYMAPEQIRGNPPVSHRTDLYALGCLLYQMLTGQPPFLGRSAVILMHAHMTENPPRPSFKNPEVPRALDDLVVKLMSKNPEDRSWDAASVAHQLEQIRDKADRGEPIRMAFDPAPSAQADTIDGTPVSTSTKAARKKARASNSKVPSPPLLTRHHVELGSLLLIFLALIGFVGYMAWPPSRQYLYKKAEALMESSSRSDWVRARDKYIDPLQRRFPDYESETVNHWLDKILKREAEDRAVYLTGTNPITNRAKNEAEELFKKAHQAARPAEDQRQYALALQYWTDFVEQLERRDDPDERGWKLFGMDLVAEQINKLEAQHKAAELEFTRAEQLLEKGQNQLAKIQFNNFIETYQNSSAGDPILARMIDQALELLEELEKLP